MWRATPARTALGDLIEAAVAKNKEAAIVQKREATAARKLKEELHGKADKEAAKKRGDDRAHRE